jgi:hypothetical protein
MAKTPRTESFLRQVENVLSLGRSHIINLIKNIPECEDGNDFTYKVKKCITFCRSSGLDQNVYDSYALRISGDLLLMAYEYQGSMLWMPLDGHIDNLTKLMAELIMDLEEANS